MQKATIENIYGTSPITKDGKTTYSFSVLLSDGTKGTIGFVPSKDDYKVGQEIEYEVKVNGNYTNIIVKKPKKAWLGGSQKDYPKEHRIIALQCATNFYMHRGTSDTSGITPLADKLLNWLEQVPDGNK